MGPEVIAFEKELAQNLGAPHVVTVNSCTSALFLALVLNEIGPGDDVLVPSLTWCSTANAAIYVGARPIFCDVDPDTLCVTPATVCARLTPRTKAVIVVHFGGRAADVAAIRRVLPRGVALIEDAAHALGARFPNGRAVGSSGNVTCFSFYSNKNLSTGDGGALALADRNMAERARSLRQSGLAVDAWKRFSEPRKGFLTHTVRELGYKMNYTDLQAAIGRVQLKRNKEFARKRLAIARRYEDRLGRVQPSLGFIHGQTAADHARHLFLVKLPLERMRISREKVFLNLRSRNIGVSLHYHPLHLMPFYRKLCAVSLPKTEEAYRRIMTLPISASMTMADADYVIAHVTDIITSAVK